MTSSIPLLVAFLCIGWTATGIWAFPSAKSLFQDSIETREFVSRYRESLKQAFPNESTKATLYSQTFGEKCLEDLGCYKNGYPFYHPLLRPVSLLPFDLKDMHTKFYLYTSQNERVLLEPNAESLAKAPYNTSLGLQIFVHGYLMKFTPKILAAMEDGIDIIIKADRQNTILVDWTASNQEPYAQAVANGRVVGAQIAQLVNFLQKAANLDPKDVYIIGHSLGAHVAGWAGKRIPNLGRITGLDPAGPYFQYGPPEIRLYFEDANFVDIIHTDIAGYYVHGLGIVERIGDIDFYPNSGQDQPGCVKTFIDDMTYSQVPIIKADYEISPVMCNHVRALDYFLESAANKECKFIGTVCPSYSKYKRGKCSVCEKSEMGFFAKKDPKRTYPVKSEFYLTTSDKSPFCIPEK